MRIQKPIRYFLALGAFPLWFLLHVINENFWLIPFLVLLTEFLQYLLVAIVIGAFCYFIIRERTKAFFFSCVLLSLYFFFAPVKDLIDNLSFTKMLQPYSVLLPVLGLLVVISIFLIRRSKRSFEKPVLFFLAFLLINLVVESGILGYKLVTNAKERNDHGDAQQKLIMDHPVSKSSQQPDVYWLVFDEYASSSSMAHVWGFRNPLDSQLQGKGFFIADSATSNYNYTPYSLLSTLDMQYLRGYGKHSHVNAIDIAKSTYGVRETNVVSVFENLGYRIFNYSIYDFTDHPSKGDEFFDYLPRTLITSRTLSGRIRKDIGWWFNDLFSKNKKQADSIRKMNSLVGLDKEYDALIDRSHAAIRSSSSSQTPGFYLFHFQMPHEPYMYDSLGMVQYQQGINHTPENYLKHLSFTNKVVVGFADSILKQAANKNFVIVISGDHGFKFDETEPEFDTEGCRIMYAVYCSDKDYSRWYRSVSGVNSFRIIFNKYFNAGMPLLRDTSFNLYYRRD